MYRLDTDEGSGEIWLRRLSVEGSPRSGETGLMRLSAASTVGGVGEGGGSWLMACS
jgi:hypothetical protein